MNGPGLQPEQAAATRQRSKRRLRTGFSTGTASTAAALAALRLLTSGRRSDVVAVRLPAGFYLPVPVSGCDLENGIASATVVKDGGDDPDATHGAKISVRIRLLQAVGKSSEEAVSDRKRSTEPRLLCLIAGSGVGVVTKPGLPVRVGEPAINPVPRQMLLSNLAREWGAARASVAPAGLKGWERPSRPHIVIPFESGGDLNLEGMVLELEIIVPGGAEIARRTLNPRLGILGGISILGTSGIVRPLSHKAYEETIRAALSVAASAGLTELVLSTGGRSERFARAVLPHLPQEAFVQIADFFAFSVREARSMGFRKVTHAVFFGKVVKMACGHGYTHAHTVPMDLEGIGRMMETRGYDAAVCEQISQANTARHAMEILLSLGGRDILDAICAEAALVSSSFFGEGYEVKILLFDFEGGLLTVTRAAGVADCHARELSAPAEKSSR